MAWLIRPALSALSLPLNRSVHITAALLAEPMKKKKKVDHSAVLERLRKKQRRIEKEIKRMEKRSRDLKPIEELEVDRELQKNLDKRRRSPPALSEEEQEARVLLGKEWARFKWRQELTELVKAQTAERTRSAALSELKELCPDLYEEAVKIDDSIFPLIVHGPVATMPSASYVSPDGQYSVQRKEFHYAFNIDNKLVVDPRDKKKVSKGR